jgi:hypothetical protein
MFRKIGRISVFSRVCPSLNNQTSRGTGVTSALGTGAELALGVSDVRERRCPFYQKRTSIDAHGMSAFCRVACRGIGLHPKVVRQALRLAFLMPDVTSAILEGRQPAGLSLAQIPKLLPLSWTEHQRLLG